MKTLKLILAAVILLSLAVSCKKQDYKKLVTNGVVTYEVIETDTLVTDVVKHVRYGYDSNVFDTIIRGSFKIDLQVPASDGTDDKKKIFITCESETETMFMVRISQICNATNSMNFKCYAEGTCRESFRQISHETVITN